MVERKKKQRGRRNKQEGQKKKEFIERRNERHYEQLKEQQEQKQQKQQEKKNQEVVPDIKNPLCLKVRKSSVSKGVYIRLRALAKSISNTKDNLYLFLIIRSL